MTRLSFGTQRTHPLQKSTTQNKVKERSFFFRVTVLNFFSFFLATINMTFENVEDAAGFTGAIFKSDKEKVYMVEPNFINPRKTEDLFHDYSANCVIM